MNVIASNKNTKNSKREFLVFFISFLFLFIYVFLRAYFISFAHDESLTYTILQGNVEWKNDPNNHVLNTFLMRWIQKGGGNIEWVLRLPNILAFIVYGWAFWKIVRTDKKGMNQILLFCLLFFNPFILDLFSVARGYGLSLGFLLMSLLFLLKTPGKESTIHSFTYNFFFSVTWASLALFSNLAVVNYYIALLGIWVGQYLYVEYVKKKGNSGVKWKLCFLFLGAIIPLGYGLNRLLWLKGLNKLYIGEKSVWNSLDILLQRVFYFSNYSEITLFIMKLIIPILFILGIFSLFLKKENQEKGIKTGALLILILLGLFLEFHLFGANYPTARTAVYLIPIYSLFLYYSLFKNLCSYRPKIGKVLTLIPSVILALHFFSNIQLKKTVIWNYDAHTKQVMQIIQENIKGGEEKKTMSNNWLFEPTINYYISTNQIKLEQANRAGVNFSSDFIYDFKNQASPEGFEKIAEFEEPATILWKKKSVVSE